MDEYRQEREELDRVTGELEKRSSTYSGIRFVMFLAAVAALIIGIYDSHFMLVLFGIVATVAFVALVFVHGRLSEQIEYRKARSEVFRRYESRFSEEWKKFAENGSQYLKEDDLVARDMDLIGPNSLYQFICVAGTEDGRRSLAESIKNPSYDIADIETRQEAIRELADKRQFSMDFETLGVKTGMGKKKYTADEFVAYCNGDDHIPGIFNVLRFALPLVTVLLFILGVTGQINIGWTLVSFFAVLLFSWLFGGVAGQSVMPMISFGYVIEDYIRIFDLFSYEIFVS